MFDARLLPLTRRILRPTAKWLHETNMPADHITLGGFAIGLLACIAAALGAFGWALLGLALNRLADGLDGEVARIAGPSDRGAFLDIALDFVFYALFPVAFALHDPATNALPAAVLVGTFVGAGSSFLAFSIIAEKRGISSQAYPTKGIYYLGGLCEGAETIAVLAAFCLFPSAFPALAWGFAAACAITTASRLLAGWKVFAD
ncbi:MAG: CDP-alcohol phosphatidyltransferase family protein [Pseudomonadota bacterium]